MTRGYDELVGRLFDRVPAPLVFLLLLLITGLIAVLWYWFPAWVPRRLPRVRLPRLRMPKFRLPRWRRRRRKPRRRKPRRVKAARAAPEPVADDGEATVVAAPRPGMSLADRLAAEGRYAEAIRERLRDTVADLTRAGVIAPQPGTTAAELAADAADRRPAIGAPLGGATAIFSEIWYGQREASPGHDERMRTLTDQVRATVPSRRPQ
ncbi:DUF4129 domain-containing protein [Paractinoplanes durhamensis]|uniref:Protein-glutamine gamma-glutamyltransferase-like C-terminal domain-containing protein n=1 Tax=Paractinoplanes durhamensis TaxID=113563 RepID=A0ABQ3Z5L7_9ACTN|nr:DUF4129 domain-containing protein [Actinoplanes durhamensis]GIE05123.1 hypothetical protein Adu01nite_64730 [Actinoplanes durhamensis]